MNKKAVMIIVTFIAAVIVCLLVIILIKGQHSHADVPDEINNLVEDYMTAYKEGTEKAVELMHFNNKFKREAYIATGDRLLDYNIQGIEKINDSLYAVSALVKTKQTILYNGDDFELVYNFVAKIDGQWKYINGLSNVPEELRENLDPSKYTYQGENILGSEDIIIPINP